jgi:hypothetical protein
MADETPELFLDVRRFFGALVPGCIWMRSRLMTDVAPARELAARRADDLSQPGYDCSMWLVMAWGMSVGLARLIRSRRMTRRALLLSLSGMAISLSPPAPIATEAAASTGGVPARYYEASNTRGTYSFDPATKTITWLAGPHGGTVTKTELSQRANGAPSINVVLHNRHYGCFMPQPAPQR